MGKMKNIFLISGFAQHGKDTTAKFIQKHIDGRTLILHNADYLKYICKEYLNWNGNKDIEGRTLLQILGTQRVRLELNKPLFWIEKTCDVIEILQRDYDYFCVPDTRYINEIHYPKAKFPNKIFSIRINRTNFENNLTEEQRNHISETELEHYRHDIELSFEEGLDIMEEKII